MYIKNCLNLLSPNQKGLQANQQEDTSMQTDPCSGEDCMEKTTQDSLETDSIKLDIGEGDTPEKNKIIIEVEVDNVEAQGNEDEERVSNEDIQYNVTIECWDNCCLNNRMKQASIWTWDVRSPAPIQLEVSCANVLCVILARVNQNMRSESYIICS